jgi:hypothetical protein
MEEHQNWWNTNMERGNRIDGIGRWRKSMRIGGNDSLEGTLELMELEKWKMGETGRWEREHRIGGTGRWKRCGIERWIKAS